MRRTRVSTILVLACVLAACKPSRVATEADCLALLDRLVDLEVGARGFHDPVLAARWRAEARARFGPELLACRTKRLRGEALACAERAQGAADLEACLR